MTIYTVITTFYDGLFGSYSSIPRARKAIEYYLNEASDIISFQDIGDYTYQYTTENNETFSMTILTDTLDWEYETNQIKDDK